MLVYIDIRTSPRVIIKLNAAFIVRLHDFTREENEFVNLCVAILSPFPFSQFETVLLLLVKNRGEFVASR